MDPAKRYDSHSFRAEARSAVGTLPWFTFLAALRERVMPVLSNSHWQ